MLKVYGSILKEAYYCCNTVFMKDTRKSHDEDALFAAFMQLKSVDEVRNFLYDLCTPGEIASFAERWEIARKLDQGGQGYREIAAQIGSSTTTVARVARFLFQERYAGYKTILARIKGH